MRLRDKEAHFNYLRATTDQFDHLINIIKEIEPIYWVREPISAAERLSLTLRYLASGDSMASISYAFRIGKSTISAIIRTTCDAIWVNLKDVVLLNPSETSWENISRDFEELWQLPNCIGAIDGKHVVIQAPPKSGSTFFNYKHTHSIILLAMCDAKYRFTLVDIGAAGRQNDGGVFRNSKIGQIFVSGEAKLPQPKPIEYEGDAMGYCMVADEAFPLTPYIMRPYPGRFLDLNERIFNYRLSRGRRVVENAFGILTSRWRIYKKPIIACLATIENIVRATICLHNWLMYHPQNTYCCTQFVDNEDECGNTVSGEWRTGDNAAGSLQRTARVGSNMHTRAAFNMREARRIRYARKGAVPFQWDK